MLVSLAMLLVALAMLLISLQFLIGLSAREVGHRAVQDRRADLAADAERARYARECTRARNVRAMEKRVYRRQRREA